MELRNRVALLTGAASGIGLALAEGFASEGARVAMLDLNEAAVQNQAQRLRESGLEVTGYTCDVTDEEQVLRVIQEIVSRYGTLDIVVNNAGLQHVSPLEEFPTATFEKMIRVMLTAPFVMIKHALPIMKQQQRGRIINMASINGLVGFAGKAAYNSAKHGLIGLTKVAALEAATHGVTVNALCPGYVDTPLVRGQLADLAATRGVPLESVLEEVIYPLVPQKRLLSVEEIADYAVFLASDKGRGITGTSVVIDGGYTAQ